MLQDPRALILGQGAQEGNETPPDRCGEVEVLEPAKRQLVADSGIRRALEALAGEKEETTVAIRRPEVVTQNITIIEIAWTSDGEPIGLG